MKGKTFYLLIAALSLFLFGIYFYTSSERSIFENVNLSVDEKINFTDKQTKESYTFETVDHYKIFKALSDKKEVGCQTVADTHYHCQGNDKLISAKKQVEAEWNGDWQNSEHLVDDVIGPDTVEYIETKERKHLFLFTSEIKAGASFEVPAGRVGNIVLQSRYTFKKHRMELNYESGHIDSFVYYSKSMNPEKRLALTLW